MLALIGDVHGCIAPLREIVELALKRTSVLVFLGDYINRGSDASAVVEHLATLQNDARIETHFLAGNHDIEFQRVLQGEEVDTLLRMGGAPTIRSYVDHPYGDVGQQLRDAVPRLHRDFFSDLASTFEIDGLIASHTSPERLRAGRYAVSAHSPRHTSKPEIGPSAAFIDTGCGTLDNGRLTSLYWPSLEWDQSAVARFD